MPVRSRPLVGSQQNPAVSSSSADGSAATPAAPTAAELVPATTANVHARQDLENWGHVGITQWGALEQQPAVQGVLRETINDQFSLWGRAPDLRAVDLPNWVPVAGHANYYYQMVWPDCPVGKYVNLLELGAQLGRQKGRLAKNHPELALLDRAAEQLVSLVQRLDALEIGVGLLTPRSVLIRKDGAAPALVLPDLGFAWLPLPESNGPPSWLAPTGLAPKLWLPLTPEQQQVVRDGRPALAHTLTVVARIFIMTLLGPDWLQQRIAAGLADPCRVPSEDEEPHLLDDVWSVLEAGAAGALTVDEFRAGLAAHPLSEYFLTPHGGHKQLSPLPSDRRRRAATGAAAALVLLLGVGGWLYLGRFVPDPGGAPAGDPVVVGAPGPLPAASTLGPLLAQFTAAPLHEQSRLLEELYDDKVALCLDPEDRAVELWHKEDCRRRFRSRCMERYRQALDDYLQRQDRQELFDAVKQAETSLRRLRQLPTFNQDFLEEEQRCLGEVCDFLRFQFPPSS